MMAKKTAEIDEAEARELLKRERDRIESSSQTRRGCAERGG